MNMGKQRDLKLETTTLFEGIARHWEVDLALRDFSVLIQPTSELPTSTQGHWGRSRLQRFPIIWLYTIAQCKLQSSPS